MYLIKTIPIARGVGVDSLTYWSPKPAVPGSLLRVPLRKRIISAIVTNCETVADLKAEIKSASFEFKKITNPHSRSIISPQFFKVAEQVSKYYAGSIGSVLFELIPTSVLADYEKIPEAKITDKKRKSHESYVLQKNDEDRYGHYKSLIRERFAKKESIFLIMPTAEDIKKACSYLEKGIEQYTYIFHSGLPKKEINKLWKKALEDAHPIVIVATGLFLAIPREDIGLIVIEKENSRSYKIQSRPFLDYRMVGEIYAKEICADLIFGDSCLRVETLFRQEEGDLVEYAPLRMRSLSTARDLIINMKTYKNINHNFRIISDELISLAKKNHEENGQLFIFAGRKGLASQTICSDCESIITCDKCSIPLTLHGKDENRFFLCNRCGKHFDSHTTCKYCKSWRLTTLGIGTELVEKELEKLAPNSKIFRLDKISAPTHKKVLEKIESWYNTPGGIMVGTELALLYLDKPIGYSAIASLDALFSIPDFRINEKIFFIVTKIRSITQKQFLLQTRNPESTTLILGAKGNIIDFYRQEIDLRKKFDFPPFSTFIKISYVGKKDEVLGVMEKLKSDLSKWNIDIFPAFITTINGQFIMHALIKLKRKEWINNDLLDQLRKLSPAYTINVDPESIL